MHRVNSFLNQLCTLIIIFLYIYTFFFSSIENKDAIISFCFPLAFYVAKGDSRTTLYISKKDYINEQRPDLDDIKMIKA